jgi:hypothetical protein
MDFVVANPKTRKKKEKRKKHTHTYAFEQIEEKNKALKIALI